MPTHLPTAVHYPPLPRHQGDANEMIHAFYTSSSTDFRTSSGMQRPANRANQLPHPTHQEVVEEMLHALLSLPHQLRRLSPSAPTAQPTDLTDPTNRLN